MSLDFTTFKKTFSLFAPEVVKNKTSLFRCCFALLFILADIFAATYIPYFSKEIVDSLSNHTLATVSVCVLLVGTLWTIEKIVNHLQEIVFFPVINYAIRNITYKVINHLHHLPLSVYQTLSLPEIINSIRRISFSARSFIKILVLMIFPTIIKLSIATYVAVKLGGFGWGVLVAFVISCFILYRGTKWYIRTREDSWQTTDRVVARMNDSILNTKIIRFFNKFEMAEIGEYLNQEAFLWYKTNTRLHFIPLLIGLVLGLTLTCMLYFTVNAIQTGTLTVGDFIFLKGQLIAAFLPFRTFSQEFRQLSESTIDIKQIIHLLDLPSQPKLPFSFSPLDQLDVIRFNNITFGHDSEAPLFTDFTLNIKKNDKILIMGTNGSGKSTLLALMIGLYKIQKGRILLFGQDISFFSNEVLGQLICYIPQDFRLFNKSIRYNLTYGLNDISDKTIIETLEILGLNWILKPPFGLDTIVGEMGTRLSGGEQQMTILARAMLLKPSILLLDETTHSLTTEVEIKILTELFKVIPTVVIVSHKPLSLPEINRVYILKDNTVTSTRESNKIYSE